MRVAITGTPGTGKTTATERLDHEVVHLNDVIRADGLDTGTDESRESLVADMDAVAAALDEREKDEIELVESHLAHRLPADRVVVLRCHPDELGERLAARGESERTVEENRESEALDVILAEAVESHGLDSVYEIDATERTPEETAAEIERVVAGEREPSAGTVSFLDAVSVERR
ncbi:adenylate kinase family protein [Halococcus sediminicola]|uniref:adenylate kinase family protein n=1 Tax=Halococcus sediminicola TaxID=1264579 RepID=UPI000679CFEE|nr:adenylate kinase family protein [Halococcus sediminicola]